MNFTILLLLLIPALYALANIVDKFLVFGDGDDSKPGALMAITGFFSLLLAIIVGIWMFFTDQAFDVVAALPVMALSGLTIASFWIYLYVLRFEEVSRAAPWFQTIPLFGLVFAAVTIHEIPSLLQVVGIITLFAGGFWLSAQEGKTGFKTLAFMMLSSALVAVYGILFKDFSEGLSSTQAIAASLLGNTFFGFLLLFGKKTRHGFILGLRTKFKMQATTEGITLLANALISFSVLKMPVAIVQANVALQPLFVLVFAVILAKRYPKVFSKETHDGPMWKKASCIVLMTIGGAILAATVV